MRRLLMAVSGIVLLASCASQPPAKPPLSERQQDSVIGASRLPGAAGVRGALRIADSAAARRARADSIARQP